MPELTVSMRKNKWSLVYYVVMLACFALLIYFVLQTGKRLEGAGAASAGPVVHSVVAPAGSVQLTDSLFHNLSRPLPVLLLQVVVIVMVARLFGMIFTRLGQPAVIGEIVAGIVLGPSVLGLVASPVSGFLFPPESLGNLQFLSQVGLILFMFVIGMELDAGLIRRQAFQAVIISHASIIIPYAFGMGLAIFLYHQFAPLQVSFLFFSLFLGIAMSITAFPVLARILQERGITTTRLGTMALTCAAANDVTAWCILAVLIALTRAGSSSSAFLTIGLVILYLCFMIWVVRPLLAWLVARYNGSHQTGKTMMAFVFIVLLLSAYLTETIGIHALFGSFMAGVVMPQQFNFRKSVIGKMEDISIVLLLPLFFVFTGLRTQIGLLNQGYLWAACGWILLVAVAGKFGGSALSARITGESWKDSLSIGALMNTRGLMELIVLNIGYDLGILSPEIFAMMILMALVTTLMTGPTLNLINRISSEKDK